MEKTTYRVQLYWYDRRTRTVEITAESMDDAVMKAESIYEEWNEEDADADPDGGYGGCNVEAV